MVQIRIFFRESRANEINAVPANPRNPTAVLLHLVMPGFIRSYPVKGGYCASIINFTRPITSGRLVGGGWRSAVLE